MIRGIDYSLGHADPRAFKRAGYAFVCRYLSTPGNRKNLGAAEAKALRAAGVGIVTVFETTATRSLAGRAAGIADARSASAQLRELGAPAGAPVYFAVDFDATPAQQAAIDAYLTGAASVLGRDRVGIYGGFWPLKRALDAGVCRYAWQTYAWSGRQWDPRAQLRQVRNGVHELGLELDQDEGHAADFGQWDRPTPQPPKPPAPAPAPMPSDEGFWTWLRWYTGQGEFALYGPRNRHVRPNVGVRQADGSYAITPAWWSALRRYLKSRPKGSA